MRVSIFFRGASFAVIILFALFCLSIVSSALAQTCSYTAKVVSAPLIGPANSPMATNSEVNAIGTGTDPLFIGTVNHRDRGSIESSSVFNNTRVVLQGTSGRKFRAISSSSNGKYALVQEELTQPGTPQPALSKFSQFVLLGTSVLSLTTPSDVQALFFGINSSLSLVGGRSFQDSRPMGMNILEAEDTWTDRFQYIPNGIAAGISDVGRLVMNVSSTNTPEDAAVMDTDNNFRHGPALSYFLLPKGGTDSARVNGISSDGRYIAGSTGVVRYDGGTTRIVRTASLWRATSDAPGSFALAILSQGSGGYSELVGVDGATGAAIGRGFYSELPSAQFDDIGFVQKGKSRKILDQSQVCNLKTLFPWADPAMIHVSPKAINSSGVIGGAAIVKAGTYPQQTQSIAVILTPVSTVPFQVLRSTN